MGTRIAQDLQEAARALGFPVQVNSGYRTAQEQQALQGTGLAAPVGHSLHEQGNAVDLNWNSLSPDQQKALVDYMTSKGYRWGNSFGEPWHFDLAGQTPEATQGVASSTPPVVTPAPEPVVQQMTPSTDPNDASTYAGIVSSPSP